MPKKENNRKNFSGYKKWEEEKSQRNQQHKQVWVPAHEWEPDFSEGEPSTESMICGLCNTEHTGKREGFWNETKAA